MNKPDGGEESATFQVTQDYPAGEPYLEPFRLWNVTCCWLQSHLAFHRLPRFELHRDVILSQEPCSVLCSC